MKGKYLRRISGLMLASLMLAGIVFISPISAEAQRRVIIVRPYPYRFYRRRSSTADCMNKALGAPPLLGFR